MSSIDVSLVERCSSCSANAQVLHVQSYRPHRLHYSQGFTCSNCGAGWEADGGDIDPGVYAALLASHGRWRTRLDDEGSNRLAIATVLTSGIGMSRRDALQLLGSVPVNVFEGTLPEAERWRDALVAAGGLAACVGSDAE